MTTNLWNLNRDNSVTVDVSQLELKIIFAHEVTLKQVAEIFSQIVVYNPEKLSVHDFRMRKIDWNDETKVLPGETIRLFLDGLKNRPKASSEDLFLKSNEPFEEAFRKWVESKQGPVYIKSYNKGSTSLQDPLFQSFVRHQFDVGQVRIFDCHAIAQAFPNHPLLESSKEFKEFAKLCLNQKLQTFRHNANRGDFEVIQTHHVAEYFADELKKGGAHPYLNLFHFGASQLIPFIEKVIERDKPFRCQILLDQGHFTCLDLMFDGEKPSMVILDSINEFGPTLTGYILELQNRFKFTIFLSGESMPSLGAHKVTVLGKPANDCFNFYLKNEKWYLQNYVDEIEIESEKAVVKRLENFSNNEKEVSELIKELYKTSLPLPKLQTKSMQTDRSSCGSFALYFAITAGKIGNLHEMCQAINQEDPIIKRLSSNLGNRFSKVNIALWELLPDEFSKWSQSTSLQRCANVEKGSIAEGMKLLVLNTLQNVEVTDLETRDQRINRLGSI